MSRRPPPSRPHRSPSPGAHGTDPPEPASGAATEGFAERVYALVRRVPRGRVVSYGGVAAMLGTPRAARGVGWALSALPDGHDVPWWRVVNRNGEISIKGAPGLPALQRSLLEGEGVEFDEHGRIDWKRFGWRREEGEARGEG